jgi:hypothetical protein
MSIDMPSEELMNKLYDVKVEKISVGTELTIAYMVEGDSLYRFVSHLQLMDDMKYMLIRHGFELEIKYANKEWSCEIARDGAMHRIVANNEFNAVLKSAEFALRIKEESNEDVQDM